MLIFLRSSWRGVLGFLKIYLSLLSVSPGLLCVSDMYHRFSEGGWNSVQRCVWGLSLPRTRHTMPWGHGTLPGKMASKQMTWLWSIDLMKLALLFCGSSLFSLISLIILIIMEFNCIQPSSNSTPMLHHVYKFPGPPFKMFEGQSQLL